MKGEARVIEYLNKALRHELTAVNQYWVHARLLDDWGFGKLAAKELEESEEERGHAQEIIDRIIFLEGLPNLQILDPLRIGQNLKEVLECDLAGEYVARALYHEAREVCRDAGDFVSMKLFERLLSDEEDHIDFLETQLDLVERIGIDNYALLQAKSADAAE
ncbi:bacterioferritin [Roseibium hamelinense]|uniref:Bacterioferritin n=1 Tax=Roseibium hamelinense TaxID=150831 RepID=A0A562SHY7_9HYPH|nr:bacterioferritin [Roseibium hamelinense]MTI43957.1 bacterioferritin [Roseibium hamelinense]TWI80748.1 bacterioferritin [Roseibium hamelinense]